MNKIEIYTSAYCPYCQHAKALLEARGLVYVEYRVDQDPALFDEMLQRAEGRRTVPQIFINDQGIGGFTDLQDLQQNGGLDRLLNS